MRATDGETDRQIYDSQDRASIAASRGNKKQWGKTARALANVRENASFGSCTFQYFGGKIPGPSWRIAMSKTDRHLWSQSRSHVQTAGAIVNDVLQRFC